MDTKTTHYQRTFIQEKEMKMSKQDRYNAVEFYINIYKDLNGIKPRGIDFLRTPCGKQGVLLCSLMESRLR